VRAHQSAIVIAKASNIFQQETFLLDEIWKENQALGDMERNLRRAISQENSNSFGWDWDWKNEATFFQHLKTNVIWTQFYNYDPYSPSNSEKK